MVKPRRGSCGENLTTLPRCVEVQQRRCDGVALFCEMVSRLKLIRGQQHSGDGFGNDAVAMWASGWQQRGSSVEAMPVAVSVAMGLDRR